MRVKRSLEILTFAVACAVLLGASGSTPARTIYVDHDAPGPHEGLSWNTAYKHLQDALAGASAGDEIRVAQGLYRPDQEPFPNGGLVNMGVYGRTSEASRSYFGQPFCQSVDAADINGDCRIDAEDYRLMILRCLPDAAPQ
ncbi:MAG: hypothetical protein JW741_31395 [Sedimentisphaerales bacterium]|nr:hypothetical protein [Sedimentisphaerales bacterium]